MARMASLVFCVFPVFAAPAGPSRIELIGGWRLASASKVQADGSTISAAGFSDSGWYPIHRMPATVLQVLQEDGVYSVEKAMVALLSRFLRTLTRRLQGGIRESGSCFGFIVWS